MNQDFTQHGTKLEGSWENHRNAANRQLFMDILREVYEVDQTIIGHHLVYSKQEDDNFLVEEIPSADTLIFDHAVMQKLFPGSWKEVLHELALTPVEERDACLKGHYYSRMKPAA